MRRAALVLALLVAAAGAGFALTRDDGGPFPTNGHVRRHGFAAWPADTVAEAIAECADAPEWRKDELDTALHFAAEVMGYPSPGADDWAHPGRPHDARFLINTDGVRELFLGALVEVHRYGDCWYVVDGEPREGGSASVTAGFVHRDGAPHLLLTNAPGGLVPEGRVGFGDWEAEIPPGLRTAVLEIPPQDDGATGHAIWLDPEHRVEGDDDAVVSEGVGVETFGAIPPPPAGPPARPLTRSELPAPGNTCPAGNYTGRSPEAVVRRLFRGPLANPYLDASGYPHYERQTSRSLGRDRRRLVVGDAILDATIDRTGGCARLLSIDPVDRDPPLRGVWLGASGATVDVDWDHGSQAYVQVGTTSTGAGGVLRRVRARITLPWSDDPPAADTAVDALAVLYRNKATVSVSYDLYTLGSS